MNIEDIQGLYDPKSDGMDYVAFCKKMEELGSDDQKNAYPFHDEIQDRVGKSQVETGTTLEKFLFSEGGYFDTNPRIRMVLFMDGKFHSKYDYMEFEGMNVDKHIVSLAKKNNAIPFFYFHTPGMEDADIILEKRHEY